MDEYDSRAIRTIPVSSKKEYKNQTDPRFDLNQELYHSNSANNLLNLREDKKAKSEKIKKKKHLPRTKSAKSYFDHYDINNCEHCQGIQNMLKKDKSKLSTFIQENPYFLKLFGNPRYDKNTPFLFVEDHKNNIDDDKIGLLPLPSKPKVIMKSDEEKNNLYEIQRKIVMIRRFQYGKEFKEGGKVNNNEDEGFFGKINQIQLWWKNIFKIIYIQKIFRGFRIRKRINFILHFMDVISIWQNLLDNMKMRRILKDLVYKKAKKLPNKNNLKGYDFMSKIRRKGKTYLNNNNNSYNKNLNGLNIIYNKKNKYKDYINKGNEELPFKYSNNKKENDKAFENKKIINGDDIIKNMKDLNKKSPKHKIINNLSLLTKEYFEKKDAMDKIDKIGNNVKEYLIYKNNIKKKSIKDENNNLQENGLFIDKIFIPKSIYKDIFNKNRDKNINKETNDNNKNKSKVINDKNKNEKEVPYNDFKNKNYYNKINNIKNKSDNSFKNKENDDKILNIKNHSDNQYKPGKEDSKMNKEEPQINNEITNNNNDGNKSVINSNDFIFKRKYCYIKKIRRVKNLVENNKIKNKTDEKNKFNLSNNYERNNSKYKNRNSKNYNIDKNKDSIDPKPLYNMNKFDEIKKYENPLENKNDINELNKNESHSDNKNKYDEINNDIKKKYNTNKSVNNQKDLFNMLLDISKPENFQIIKSQKIQKPLELSSSSKNNFSYNHSNRISQNNRNINNEEEKNNGQKNIYKDKNKISMIPFKKYIFGNNNCFITKVKKINEIKKVKNDINSLNKNILNNVKIDYIQSILYNGNKNQKIEKEKNNYSISYKNAQINYIGENNSKYKNREKPKLNNNDNLLVESISIIKYEGLCEEKKKKKIANNLSCFKNLKTETNYSIKYLLNDKKEKENNNKEINKNNVLKESKPDVTYIGNNKEYNNNIQKDKSDFNNLFSQTNNNFNYLVKDKEKDENENNSSKKRYLDIEYNKINIEYSGNKNNNKDSKDKDNKNNELSIESKDIINYNGLNKDYNSLLMKISNIKVIYINKDIKKNDLKKNGNLVVEKNIINYEGKKINKPNLKALNKKGDLIIETNKGFNIINKTKKNNNKDRDKQSNNLIIESISIINILSKNTKDNINDINKNLVIYEVDNFSYEGKKEENIKDINKIYDYTIDSTITINHQGKNNVPQKYKYNESDDNLENENKNNNNIKKYKNNELLNDSYFMGMPSHIYQNLCYISKERKKQNDKTNNNKNILSNYKKNKVSYTNDSSSPKNSDNNNYKKPINGLLITKVNLKSNIDKIKLIQDYIKNHIGRNKNNNEIIFKKPLFNQFFYYIDENIYGKKPKNKNKIPDNKKYEEENDYIEDDKNKKNKNNEDNDENGENKNKPKNKKINNIKDEYDGSTGPKYVERIIPKKKESRLFRLKPNHLLKIVKIQKGRSITEKLIQCGRVVPNKPKSQDENDIQNEYRSKTPENIKPNKKYNEYDEENEEEGKDNKNYLKDRNKIDDMVKNYLSKSEQENEEINIKNNEGNYTDYEDDTLRNKRIKKLKNNMGNYFYMSKIRKGNIDDSKIKTIQNNYRKYNKKNLDNMKDTKNENDFDHKNENEEKEKDNKIRPNIIKNVCYYKKIVINNDTYKQFLDIQNNDENYRKSQEDNNQIYKIPNNWKNSQFEDINNINKNYISINFITKLRYIRFKDLRKEEDETVKKNYDKNENINENKKEDKIDALKNKNIIYGNPTKFPCFISKEIKINDKKKDIKEKNEAQLKENIINLLNSNCFITKERKIKALSLPNKNYKKNQYLITKEIKYNNQNNNLLSTKYYNFKTANNNICFITKEKKLNVKKEIILPLKPIKFITKERKKIIDNNTKSILLPKKEIHFMDKIRKRENINQIKTIQNLFKLKNSKNKEKDNKNKLLYNNEEKTAFIPRTKFNFIDIEDSSFSEENLEKDNYYLNGYIDKIYKRNIYKYPIGNICYILKQYLFREKGKNKKNYSFLTLMDFFIKKNVQEYAFPRLIDKTNENKNKILDTNYNFDTNNNPINENINDVENKFTYPKYYNYIKRIYDFYKNKKRGNSPRAKKIYNEILPDLENCRSLNDLITKLNNDSEKRNKLINKKDDKINEDDYINEVGEFTKFDKNLSNSAFIKNKLKENQNKDNNIFNVIKTVDDEYNNLINGKYCLKCAKEKTKCKCDDIDYLFKETEESKNNSIINIGNKKEDEDGDNLDFNIGDDDSCKSKKINYFEYDSNKSKGLLITNKPKLSDYISKPKNNLIIYNQKQLNQINQKIIGTDKNNICKFINSNNNYSFNEGNSYQSNSSLSGNRYNNRYNNFNNNSITFNNDINNLKSSKK